MTYLDVRSISEFETAHPAGAFNVPLLHVDHYSGQMRANPDFVAVVKANFPENTPLLVGCQAGVRSLQACQVLSAAGYTDLTNVAGGFGGSPHGEAGWAQAGLPVESAAAPGHDYATLQKKASEAGGA